ncbi:MAG: hypothetical protein QOI83_2399 [Streptomycetaceae bacterium]|nr:hypothetical protein [Streptomycetaceae bacterium]
MAGRLPRVLDQVWVLLSGLAADGHVHSAHGNADGCGNRNDGMAC